MSNKKNKKKKKNNSHFTNTAPKSFNQTKKEAYNNELKNKDNDKIVLEKETKKQDEAYYDNMPEIKKDGHKIENNLKSFLKGDGVKSIASSLISIIIGLIVGFIVMLAIAIVNKDNSISDAFSGIIKIVKGPFSSTIKKFLLSGVGNMIFYSVPLIMTGLSVGLAYKTGLFNIGAPGQYVMGTIGCLTVALSIQTTNRTTAILVWLLALIVGMILGMIWGIIPGILKAFLNINEVIIGIMTNWIAANIATWYFINRKDLISTENTKGGFLLKNLSNYTPKLGLDKLFPGSYIDAGIIIAIIFAIVIFIILNKTTFGYQIKACGSNKNAAKYAGLNEKLNIVASMAISGAIAAAGACLFYLNDGVEYSYSSQYNNLPAYGFNGIASAFLANCNPIAIVFSSLFIRYINAGGEYLTSVGFNRYIADIVIAMIIYIAGFSRIIRELISKGKKKSNKEKEEQEKDKHQEILNKEEVINE